MADQHDDHVHHPRDALGAAARAALLTGTAGLFVASVQNTVSKHNVGAMGVFSQFGRTVGTFAAVGGAYQFGTSVSGNLREKDDFINHAIGGAMGGSIIGLAKRSMPSLLGGSLALAVSMAVVSYTGRSIFESQSDEAEPDRAAHKENVKARYRRPVNETINELGEGRGIYGPGYAERRKQRIKEKYGIDIQEPYYNNTSTTAS